MNTSPGKSHCASCGAEIEISARYCPSCGVAAPVMGSQEDDIETTATLAAANLARIRRDWQGAIEKTEDALKRDPDNPSAHALMGDIFQNQNNLEEAESWYTRALDLDPSNISIKTKLDRTQMILRSKQTTQQLDEDESDLSSKVDDFIKSDNYKTIVNLLLFFLMAVVVIVVVAGIFNRITGPRTETPGSGRSGEITGNQPPVQPNSTQSSRPLPGQNPGQNRAANQPATENQASILIPAESTLLTRIRESLDANDQTIKVDAALADPRTSEVTIIVVAGRSTQSRLDFYRLARQAALATVTSDPRIAIVSVRINARLQNELGVQTEQIAFLGDITKEQAGVVIEDSATEETFEQQFTNLYWHPSIRQ